MAVFRKIVGDIFEQDVDVMVIPANTRARCGSGLDALAYSRAGSERMLKARQEVGELRFGSCGVTEGFDLKAGYVIHCVSPYYGIPGWEKLLCDCYVGAVKEAEKLGAKSMAFPLLCSGRRKLPVEVALDIAVDVLRKEAEKSSLEEIILVITGKSQRTYESRSTLPEEQLEELYADRRISLRNEQFEKMDPVHARIMADRDERREFINELHEYLKNNPSSTEEIYCREEVAKYISEKIGKGEGRLYRSQDALAQICQISPSDLTRIKSGERGKVDNYVAVNIALALHLPINSFKRFIFCTGNAFPTNDCESKIANYISENGYRIEDNGVSPYDQIMELIAESERDSDRSRAKQYE